MKKYDFTDLVLTFVLGMLLSAAIALTMFNIVLGPLLR